MIFLRKRQIVVFRHRRQRFYFFCVKSRKTLWSELWYMIFTLYFEWKYFHWNCYRTRISRVIILLRFTITLLCYGRNQSNLIRSTPTQNTLSKTVHCIKGMNLHRHFHFRMKYARLSHNTNNGTLQLHIVFSNLSVFPKMFSTENRHFSVFSNWRKFPKVIYVISMLSIQPQVFYVSDELTNNILSFLT